VPLYIRLPAVAVLAATSGTNGSAGDPRHAATFAMSSCAQSGGWNPGYVVDLHGNATAYSYIPEYNNYGADMQNTPMKYIRGGYLTQIDYGMTASTVYKPTRTDPRRTRIGACR
jgi:hypothetical protein